MPHLDLRRLLVAVLFGLLVFLPGLPAAAQATKTKAEAKKLAEKPTIEQELQRFERQDRDVLKAKDQILAACQLKPGMSVADVGSGSGVFTRLFAAKVGPEGKAYAVDINKKYLEYVEKKNQEQGIKNIVPVLCTTTSTELKPQSIDLAYICDTYHHFDHPMKTLASIHAGLRSGGMLVVVDFTKQGKMADHVKLDKQGLIEQITSAGFVLDEDLTFLEPEQHVLRFRKAMRAPAVPLVVHDPYFSVWSPTDRLADSQARHWTGTPQPMCSMAWIDGKGYRLMDTEPKDVPAMQQAGLQVLPTRTIYEFETETVHVRLTFTSPLLPQNLDLISRPVTYLTWDVWSLDGREHDLSVYFDVPQEFIYSHNKDAADLYMRSATHYLTDFYRKTGIHARSFYIEDPQPVLEKKGDNLRIDWGYFYTASRDPIALASRDVARAAFAKEGKIPHEEMKFTGPVAACVMRVGKVGKEKVTRRAMVAYDDVYSIEYLGEKLRPWWRRNGMGAEDLLIAADAEYPDLAKQCEKFDRELLADAARVGRAGYADLCALAYREAMGAHKLAAGPEGRPMFFPKENFSNGCISTVDVIYPAAPIFALVSNDLLKATCTPVFEYALTPRWKFPFAPHDVGTYPKANGQVYGGGEKTEKDQMPVEESGNMLILAALISQIDGNTKYVDRYWLHLERWAKYLKEKGLDPENQLCTDDFAGHLAHNANLSLKAIVALAAYSKLCAMKGLKEQAAEYRGLAEEYAKKWPAMAEDGDHYRLAFDRPGTWSQKYNLVWDKLLDLKLFPAEITRKEIAYYKTKLNPYGLPLDNRENYTKTDWEVWTATLAESRADFDTLMGPVYRFVDATQPRVPMTDWYFTRDAKMRGFQARPVIGGLYIKMLDDPAAWKKWSAAGEGRQ
jgi:ubiquinone/menaquinone biosynthesis C-methylase UbiE